MKLCLASGLSTQHRTVGYMRDLDPGDDEAGALCREEREVVSGPLQLMSCISMVVLTINALEGK